MKGCSLLYRGSRLMLARTRIPENRLHTRTCLAWAMSGAGNNIVDIDEDYTVCGNDRYLESVARRLSGECMRAIWRRGRRQPCNGYKSVRRMRGSLYVPVVDVLLDTGSNELLGIMNYARYRKYRITTLRTGAHQSYIYRALFKEISCSFFSYLCSPSRSNVICLHI